MGVKGPCVVGNFPEGSSPFGLKDMAGNLWEWTSGEETLPGGGSAKILRGGGWATSELGSRPEIGVAERQWLPEGEYAADVGFRCAFSTEVH